MWLTECVQDWCALKMTEKNIMGAHARVRRVSLLSSLRCVPHAADGLVAVGIRLGGLGRREVDDLAGLLLPCL